MLKSPYWTEPISSLSQYQISSEMSIEMSEKAKYFCQKWIQTPHLPPEEGVQPFFRAVGHGSFAAPCLAPPPGGPAASAATVASEQPEGAFKNHSRERKKQLNQYHIDS